MSDDSNAKVVQSNNDNKPVETIDDSNAKVVQSNDEEVNEIPIDDNKPVETIDDDKELQALEKPEPIQKPRKKRVMTEKQLESLARGREKAKLKQKERMKKIKEYEAREKEEAKKVEIQEPTEKKPRKPRKPRQPRKPRGEALLSQREPPPTPQEETPVVVRPPVYRPIVLDFR